MWINLRGFTIGAILLVSLSLLLQGCGTNNAHTVVTPTRSTKQISGVVADNSNHPLANATVVAYPVENGVPMTVKALSSPVLSGSDGSFTLYIPSTYVGQVLFEATPSVPLAKRIAKMLFSTPSTNVIRAILPEKKLTEVTIPYVVINFATNTIYTFIQTNIVNAAAPAGFDAAGGFSDNNIQKSTLVLETFFGSNFTEVTPPKSDTDTNTSKAQQDLQVSIAAVNSILSGPMTLENLVTKLVVQGGLTNAVADAIKAAVETATSDLITSGSLPPEYIPNSEILTNISNAQSNPVVVPTLVGDKTAPSVPTGLSAVATVNSVTLLWNPSTDKNDSGGVGGTVSYSIYRAKDSSGVFTLLDTVSSPGITAPNKVPYVDTSVTSDTSYTYEIVASDDLNNASVASDVVFIKTLVPAPAAVIDVAPPSTPSLSFVGQTDDSHSLPPENIKAKVVIQWSQSTKTNNDGTVVPAAGYYVYRNSQIIQTVTGVTFTDETVDPATDYTYYVKAFDDNGRMSAASAKLDVHTFNSTLVAKPNAPALQELSIVQATTTTPAKVTLNWSVSDSPGVIGYNVYRGSKILVSGITGHSYTDGAVTPGLNYDYFVTAVTAYAESDPSATRQAQLVALPTSDPAPTAPLNFIQVGTSTQSSATLSWAASTISSGTVAGYDVLRRTSDSTTLPTVIASVNGTSFTDTTLTTDPVTHKGNAYVYYVKAFSAKGVRSGDSESRTVVAADFVDLTDVTAPAVPTGLVNLTVTSSGVPLSWTKSSSSDVAGYRVYRGGKQIADVKAGSTSTGNTYTFTDATVNGGTTYTYQVTAYDNAGNESLLNLSSVLTVTTPAKLPSYYTLRGRVTVNDIGMQGVVLILNGTGTGSVLSDANGNYSFPPVAVGDYTITAQLNGFSFSTTSNWSGAVTVSSADVAGLNFTATYLQSVSGGTTYPVGTVIGGSTYPAGTIIGGITYPSSTVIGGVTYPTATVIGGVTYPTGTVIGGITYPNGVVIGGISYPPGTVVGGVAFPPGTITANFTYPSGTVIGGVVYPSGSIVGTIANPTGVVIGGVTVASGRVLGGVTYPAAAVNSTITYPSGTIIGGITYPSSTVIGGITYTTATVIGGITYPTGSVIGGITYPNGIVIGGVRYPAGTVVGGIAFPPGTVTGTMVYPGGTVINGVIYPTGTVIGGVISPSGTAVGTITYPSGAVIGGIFYPAGRVTAGVIYPAAMVTGTAVYPSGTIIGGISYPSSTIIGGITYTTVTVVGGVSYPTGTVVGGVSYPNGVVIGGVSYPAGTIVGGVAYPPGTVTGVMAYPTGTIVGGITYPSSTVIGGITYPTATVIGGVTYPTGTVIGGITYPNGIVIGGVTYPAGTVVGGVAFPPGTVTSNFSYPTGTVIGGIVYPTGTVSGGTIYPTGTAIGAITFPTATVISGVVYPTGIVEYGVLYPTGSVNSAVSYPGGSLDGGVTYPGGSVTTQIEWNIIVYGAVADNSGLSLAGVTITVHDDTSGATTTTATSVVGTYSFKGVPGHSYTITPALSGYVFVPVTVATDPNGYDNVPVTAIKAN